MRILIDIVHPADVLFFKRPIETWYKRNYQVLILSRHKDITCNLLDEFEFPHEPISTARRGVLGLAAELARRDLAVFKRARIFRPDAMIGFGGVSISHVGQLLGIPSIAFYDSENAWLQNRITWPFISRLYVPECYYGIIPKRKSYRVPGTKELSYFHPAHFVPDQDLAVEAGLDVDTDNFLLRVVDWRANHDLNKEGWTESTLRSIVSYLSQRGRVHISSECDLPTDLQSFEYQGGVTTLHHLLGYCRLLAGESATMASEAALLGVPAVYCGHDIPGYVRELERSGLLSTLSSGRDKQQFLVETVSDLMGQSIEKHRQIRDQYVSSCPDWAELVAQAVSSIGSQ